MPGETPLRVPAFVVSGALQSLEANVPSTPKLSPTDELWDDERTAAFLGVSRVTVRRLRRKKLLPTVKVGAAARTPRSAVLDVRGRPARLSPSGPTPRRFLPFRCRRGRRAERAAAAARLLFDNSTAVSGQLCRD
jgi:hypothetical protein